MRKQILPSETSRKKRLAKHLKNSISFKKRVRQRKIIKKAKYAIKIKNKLNIREIQLPDAIFNNELKDTNSLKYTRPLLSNEFKLPLDFDIFSNPEKVLKNIEKVRHLLLKPKLDGFKMNHKNVKRNSLGSEALLGILVSEIISHRKKHDSFIDFSFSGRYPIDKDAKALVDDIGLVRELQDPDFKDAKQNQHNDKVHLFRADNRYHHGVSVKGGDKKTTTAKECVEHLEGCLNSHQLTIKKEAQDRLKACLGEVLDNANEHCGRTSSVWYVRSYFNDRSQKRPYFELMVLNLGNSIAQNFIQLPEDSDVKNTALNYVYRHDDVMDENALLTVAALQGNMSSKRDLDRTRGQGTVTLIETFESIYRDYCILRQPNGKSAEMNLISGNTIIKFDGKYKSKVIEQETGSELFRMTFNDEQSLEFPPDENYVSVMEDVYLPGVMINIRIPLNGSTIPLQENV
ncbi:hypothetical protein [Aliivibrio fischeri]|uniref:hypothetical protein n=1 Tax=Aliivibrio fischeri TaxID=668 RepID=UPI00080DA8D1|nr:hypothetical protein [Aliivibrio fischeri]OCH06554.1 hypothetical protein A6E11_17295 [Aliivibrio fischeri]